MTRVDFYILPGEDAQARRILACRIAEKAYRMKHKIFLLVDNDAEARAIDDLLWTFRQGSFLPHCLANSDSYDPLAAAAIGNGPAPEPFYDLLINLSLKNPKDWQRFQRVAEIVDQTPEVRQAGREKYRAYQQQGAELHTHKIEI